MNENNGAGKIFFGAIIIAVCLINQKAVLQPMQESFDCFIVCPPAVTRQRIRYFIWRYQAAEIRRQIPHNFFKKCRIPGSDSTKSIFHQDGILDTGQVIPDLVITLSCPCQIGKRACPEIPVVFLCIRQGFVFDR